MTLFNTKLRSITNYNYQGGFAANCQRQSEPVVLPLNKTERNIGRYASELSTSANDSLINRDKVISVIGLNNVGVVCAAGFSELGYSIIGVDSDNNRTRQLLDGKSPVKEYGLPELIELGRKNKLISATTVIDHAVKCSDITFLCGASYSDQKNGTEQFEFCQSSCQSIGCSLVGKSSYHLIIIRASFSMLAIKKRLIPTLEKYSGKLCGIDFGVCFIPENIRKKHLLQDFYAPSFLLIGAYDKKSQQLSHQLF